MKTLESNSEIIAEALKTLKDRLEVASEERKEEILQCCYSGVEEVGSFIKTQPDFYFLGLEQIREEFCKIIKLLR